MPVIPLMPLRTELCLYMRCAKSARSTRRKVAGLSIGSRSGVHALMLPAKSGLSRFLANAMSRAASSVSGNPRQLYLIRGYPAVLHKTQPYRQAALPAAIWRPAPKVSVILDEVDQRVDNGLLFESVEIEISDASDDAVEQLQWELANELLPFAGTDSFSLTLDFITRLSLTPEHVCSFDFQRVVSFKPRVRNDGIRDLRFMSLTKVPPRTTTWSQHTKSTRRDRQGPGLRSHCSSWRSLST